MQLTGLSLLQAKPEVMQCWWYGVQRNVNTLPEPVIYTTGFSSAFFILKKLLWLAGVFWEQIQYNFSPIKSAGDPRVAKHTL